MQSHLGPFQPPVDSVQKLPLPIFIHVLIFFPGGSVGHLDETWVFFIVLPGLMSWGVLGGLEFAEILYIVIIFSYNRMSVSLTPIVFLRF